jgi:four helix bundle protein
LTDSDAENAETQGWLEFAHACEYLKKDEFDFLTEKSNEVGKLLYYMMNNPDKFL